jgi:hypothetical protein
MQIENIIIYPQDTFWAGSTGNATLGARSQNVVESRIVWRSGRHGNFGHMEGKIFQPSSGCTSFYPSSDGCGHPLFHCRFARVFATEVAIRRGITTSPILEQC